MSKVITLIMQLLWFCFYYGLRLAEYWFVIDLVLVLQDSIENRSIKNDEKVASNKH